MSSKEPVEGRCGSKLRNKPTFCTNRPIDGSKRCRLHGGHAGREEYKKAQAAGGRNYAKHGIYVRAINEEEKKIVAQLTEAIDDIDAQLFVLLVRLRRCAIALNLIDEGDDAVSFSLSEIKQRITGKGPDAKHYNEMVRKRPDLEAIFDRLLGRYAHLISVKTQRKVAEHNMAMLDAEKAKAEAEEFLEALRSGRIVPA